MLAQLVTIALVIVVYSLTKNLLITILVCLAFFLIERNLRPIYMSWWYKKFPPQEFSVFKEENMENGYGQGMRGLIITQLAKLDPEEEGHKKILEDLLSEAVSSLSSEHPVFRVRYDTVMEKALPVQISCSSCKESDRSVRKAFFRWIGMNEIKPFKGEPNKENFIYDCVFTDPESGETKPAAVIILFAKNLPVK
ncbi:MAG: hypothetical protein ACOX7I_02185 [Oscillospiraceae bacterium]